MSHLKIIGTCGACGGSVSVATSWHGVYPPKPSCDACGARPVYPFGPVLEMVPNLNRKAAKARGAT